MYRQTPHAKLTAQQCADLIRHVPEPPPGCAGSYITDPIGRDFAPYMVRNALTIRAVWLLPGQQIVGHRDRLPAGTFRQHLPIRTNEHCWVHHDGIWQQLTLGCTYAMDPTLFHGAVNWGTEPRIHLMIE